MRITYTRSEQRQLKTEGRGNIYAVMKNVLNALIFCRIYKIFNYARIKSRGRVFVSVYKNKE